MKVTRHDWLIEQYKCWICGWVPGRWDDRGPNGLQCHEIARGPHRKKALSEPAAWFSACLHCHRDELDSMPIVRQLAYKWLHDRENYNRVAVNRLRGRKDGAVTQDEVRKEARKIR